MAPKGAVVRKFLIETANKILSWANIGFFGYEIGNNLSDNAEKQVGTLGELSKFENECRRKNRLCGNNCDIFLGILTSMSIIFMVSKLCKCKFDKTENNIELRERTQPKVNANLRPHTAEQLV